MTRGTVEDFVDRVDAEISWRKRELQAFKALVFNERNPLYREVLLRASVPLIYAHWEGFIKASAKEYLNFVSIRRLNYHQLQSNFVALDIETKYREQLQRLSTEDLIFIIEKSKSEDCRIGKIADRFEGIGNLSSRILRMIALSIGIDDIKFETKRHIIDEQLIKVRNNIAHGRWQSIELDFFEQLQDAVLEMMEIFRTEIQNAAILGSYRALA